MASAMDEGLEAALRETLQCRETGRGQSSMSEDDLDDYFVCSQELMTQLSEAGEAVTDTFFNGLPDSYELFVVQESFQPVKTFPELRKRLRKYNDSRKA